MTKKRKAALAAKLADPKYVWGRILESLGAFYGKEVTKEEVLKSAVLRGMAKGIIEDSKRGLPEGPIQDALTEIQKELKAAAEASHVG